MILAAGRGTRLRPLTESKPKALILVNNLPLIAHVINKLKGFGVSEIIINVHHHAQQIIDYLVKENYFGIHIEISYEKTLLNTGGGLKRTGWFFTNDQPFIVHNVDVLSNLDLHDMIKYHVDNNALATLAVRHRKTSRYLLFDKENILIGWKSLEKNEERLTRCPQYEVSELSFMGIHVISPGIFSKFPAENCFSIIDFYLNIAYQEKTIFAFHADSYFWLDMGRPENFLKADKYFKK